MKKDDYWSYALEDCLDIIASWLSKWIFFAKWYHFYVSIMTNQVESMFWCHPFGKMTILDSSVCESPSSWNDFVPLLHIFWLFAAGYYSRSCWCWVCQFAMLALLLLTCSNCQCFSDCFSGDLVSFLTQQAKTKVSLLDYTLLDHQLRRRFLALRPRSTVGWHVTTSMQDSRIHGIYWASFGTMCDVMSTSTSVCSVVLWFVVS